jgi:MFS family permease
LSRRREGWTPVAAGIGTIGVLPVFLVGALGPQLRADLGFSTAQLGLAVSAGFLTQAVVASPTGRLVDRVGPRAGIRAAAIAIACVAVGLALSVSWPMLTALVAAGGVANAIAQLAASTIVAQGVPLERQGAAFGIKEAAKPAATLICGLALPLVAAFASWRLAFAGCAVAAAGVWASAATLPAATAYERRAPRRLPRRSTGLALLASGSALGSAVAMPLGVFLVETLARSGFSPAAAGALLAAGSATSIAVRVFAGAHADRIVGQQLHWVAAMLLAGSIGLALLATHRPVTLVLGTLLAFGAGWGWPGLLNVAVVRRRRAEAGSVAGVILAGGALGGGLGPLVFGLVAEHGSLETAWLGAAALAATAPLTILAGRCALIREHRAAAFPGS